jgi:hypothetical protein
MVDARSILAVTTRSRASNALYVATAAALALAFVFIVIARSGEPLALDQGLFACFGRWPGRLPYRDLFDEKPPLFLYTWTLAWQLGGSAAAVWWFEALWLAATMGVGFGLARRWGRWAALAAAALVVVGLWSPGWGGYWSRAQADELLALPVLGAAWLALSAIERPRAALWVGVLTGIAGLYKIPGMAVAGAWPVLWLATRGGRGGARRTAWMAAGLVAPWLLAIAWFAAHGALGAMWEGVIVYPRHNAAFIAPPWGHVVTSFATTLGGELPAVLVAAAVGMGWLWRTDRPLAWWLTAWLVAMAASVMLERQRAGYQYLLVVPPLALAAAAGLACLGRAVARGGPVRAAALAALVAIAALAVVQGAAWRAYGGGVAYRLGGGDRAPYLASFDHGGFSPGVEEDVAAYLRAHSGPDDGVLVWGLGPGIYALADRHPVTRFPFHKILMTDAPLSRSIPGLADRRADLMRRLRDDPPAFVVIGTGDRNGFEPETSAASLLRFAPLARFVHDRYEPVTRIGRFIVARRRP